MKLRRGILAGLMLLGLAASPAMAADKGGPADLLPTIDNDARPFSGAYIGGLISRQMQTTEIGGLVNFNAEDFGYGAAIGYDVRFAGTNVVAGLKASYSASNVGNALIDMDSSWDVLARLGFVIGQTTLVYGLGGYTSTDGAFTVPLGVSLPDSGMTLGFGAETYLTKSLTASVELLWVDLGSAAGGVLENRMTVPRFGLNYRF